MLVDFWASWCAPCRPLAPILEEIAQEKGEKLTILKMDADANPSTPAQYRVTGLPTMNLYYKGEVVRSIVGVRPKSAILKEPRSTPSRHHLDAEEAVTAPRRVLRNPNFRASARLVEGP
ncbi:thioredoxin family protein [Aeromicrobium sp. UC242_57]|uniref:thioredoxin family protein n=1 Tax=Aeromicrobium sp. UC242_57 TaxID=3374624 RepID=UPI0037BC9698